MQIRICHWSQLGKNTLCSKHSLKDHTELEMKIKTIMHCLLLQAKTCRDQPIMPYRLPTDFIIRGKLPQITFVVSCCRILRILRGDPIARKLHNLHVVKLNVN